MVTRSSAPSSSSAKRHRSTPACARCHRLKQKCDRGTPKCRRCVLAGIECVALNRQTACEVPRSPLQFLEQRLAELRRLVVASAPSRTHLPRASPERTDTPSQDLPTIHTHIHTHRLTGAGDIYSYRNNTNHPPPLPPPPPSYTSVATFARLNITPHATPDYLPPPTPLVHRAKLLYGSERPPLKIPVHNNYHDVPGSLRTAARGYTLGSLAFDAFKVPPHVGQRLLDNYLDHILPRLPFFDPDELRALFNRFYDTGLRPVGPATDPGHGPSTTVPTYDSDPQLASFIVPLVLAISSLTSRARDFQKVAALCEALHKDALRQVDDLLRVAAPSALRCLLLMAQMALMLPYTMNLWYITGEAMRMAIGLGLHQEPEPAVVGGAEEAEKRRRIFWSAYQLDRTVAICGGCPIAIHDYHITTHLPYSAGPPSPYPSTTRLLDLPPLDFPKRNFLIHTHLRILQSQIHGIQFFDHPLPPDVTSYDTWRCDTARAIRDLIAQLGGDNAARYNIESAAHNCYLMLYRPCSRNIAITGADFMKSVVAALDITDTSLQYLDYGGYIAAFELGNNAFQAGIILLYAFRNHPQDLHSQNLTSRVHTALSSAVRLLQLLSARWPALEDTAVYLQELIDTNLRNPVGLDTPSVPYDMGVLEELDCFMTQRRVHSLYHRNIPLSRFVPSSPGTVPPVQPVVMPELAMGMSMDEYGNWWNDIVPSGFGEFGDQLSIMTQNMPQTLGGNEMAYDDPGQSMMAAPVAPMTSTINELTGSTNVSTCSTSSPESFSNPPNQAITPQPTAPTPSSAPVPSPVPTALSRQLEAIIEALPACSSCRDRRIKCPRQMPSCKECLRTSRECTIYDPVLDQNIPLHRIHTLISHIKSLEQQVPNATPTAAAAAALSAATKEPSILLPLRDHHHRHYSHHGSPTAASVPTFTYFGPWTLPSHLRHLFQTTPTLTLPPLLTPALTLTPLPLHDPPPATPFADLLLSSPTITALFSLFARTTNYFLPTIPPATLSTILRLRQSENLDQHTQVLADLALAIAMLVGKRASPTLSFRCRGHMARALSWMDGACEHGERRNNIQLLQKMLLVAVYLLLSPGDGDVWRVLGFCVRLFFDLSHRPSMDEDKDDGLFNMLTRTLYCLESQVSIAYGRPSLLIIGDDLRQTLIQPLSHSISEKVSILSYSVSFLKMQIHSIVLQTTAHPASLPAPLPAAKCQALRHSLDDWYVHWKEMSTSLPPTSPLRATLAAWGDFNYFHSLFYLSLLWPTPGGNPRAVALPIVSAVAKMVRHQQLFGVLVDSRVEEEDAVPLVYPVAWPIAQAVGQAALYAVEEEGGRGEAERIWGRVRCVVGVLEMDVDCLMGGWTEMLEAVLESVGKE